LAHHKSAIKRAITSEKSRLSNRSKKTELRNIEKKYSIAQADAKTAAARELCAVADHLARKHIIHKNKAARLKSRAQKAMNKKAA